MADTVIGTTGIFFTLALIALLSFLVGLVLYVLSDYFRLVFSHRNRAARYRMTQAAATAGRGVTLSGAALAVLAPNVAEAMGQPAYDPAEQRRLAEVLTDVMTLDLDQAMGSV